MGPSSAQGGLVPVLLAGTTPLPEQVPRALRIFQFKADLCKDAHKKLVHIMVDAHRGLDKLAIVRCRHVLPFCSKGEKSV